MPEMLSRWLTAFMHWWERRARRRDWQMSALWRRQRAQEEEVEQEPWGV